MTKAGAKTFFLGLLCFGFFMGSCNEAPTELEKTYLDTLFYKLRGNEKALNLDERALLQRKETIRNQWMPAIQDTAADIRIKMQTDFQGILTAYDFYLERYLLYMSSTKLLKEEWEVFKKQDEQNELNRKEFKAIYADLNARIDKNTREIEVFAKPVYDIEAMWLRYERMFRVKGIN